MNKITTSSTGQKNNVADKNDLKTYMSNSFPGYAFELFTISVLTDYLKAQSKRVIASSDFCSFDAFLPDGIDNWNVPIDVEVKFLRSNKSSYWRSVEQVCARFNKSTSEQLLLILGTEFSDKSKEMLNKHPENYTSKPVLIWDINDFYMRTSSYWTSNIHFLEMPQKAIVERAILNDKPKEQVSSEQIEKLSHLKQKYIDEDLVLVLGAGVSIDAKIPIWTDLIKMLLVEMINVTLKTDNKSFSKEQINQLVQLAHGNMQDSPLVQMRYIRAAFSNEDYTKIIHSVLYGNNPKSSTELLKAIVEISKPQRRRIGVKSIITYNFDNLLEQALKSKGIHFSSIYKDADISMLDCLNIYHVHGFLPANLTDFDEDVSLVFSEEDYHKIYRDAYCWSNIVQLNSFRECTCLFVGCSMTDPNLRRLLDVAARNGELPRHFAILKKQKNTNNNDFNIEAGVIETYQNINNNIRESYFNSLGINTLWVDEYDEIPKILSSLND